MPASSAGIGWSSEVMRHSVAVVDCDVGYFSMQLTG
jgi:hypothetical protein